MSLRDAIPPDVVVHDEELKHDEVANFVKEHGYEKTPLILNVEGKRVAMNFISTRERLCSYLGIKKEELAPYLAKSGYDGPIRIGKAELSRKNWNLLDLPILRYFPRDGGRYVTAGVVIARWGDVEDTNSYNACIHRLMLLDEKRLVARLVKPRHTYLLWKKAVERGEDLPVAIAIGVHPLFLFASATRVPEGKEFGYAASLMNGLDLNIIEDMLVPSAEIVLVGRITKELADEGPFVDITGTYDLVRKEPVIEIDAIYAKDDPIYYSITPASSEHQVLMGIPYEPEIYRAVAKVCRVKNVAMSPGGMHYFHAVVQIEKHSEGDGKNAILAAFAAHHSLKHVVVVDDDIDIYSSEDVEYAIATRFQADRDLVIVPNARGSSLDPSSNKGLTAKWGIDATKELSRREDFERVV
ncbi:UbiD family decarboxylase [Archaeoglobus veneficus]|uniref:Anhydromevalonate phosphate decarboxylase n=1 Tax=Archaeoglobus veneficus (strain DSM 11195 / SNP6) TaxID=693661 RepID=F2KQS7_ARCVS|nr:UbiD family decarboxylase [Archaeoglobus veneficus]AEA46639.1 UbiD family decarboxylase [Archaeoglobus veneficus SNP6]